MINIDELDEAIDHCRLEDLTPYNQGVWGTLEGEVSSCGTGACLAGTYVLMKGYHFVRYPSDNPGAIYYCADDDTGRLRRIEYVAQEGLGLDGDQANQLFHHKNDIEILEHMAKHLRDHPNASDGDLYEIRVAIHADRAERTTE